MMATRSRHTEAVSSLKALSHDPQSESIADLVFSEVVRGPGVSSIGSVMSNPLELGMDIESVYVAFQCGPRVGDAVDPRAGPRRGQGLAGGGDSGFAFARRQGAKRAGRQ